MSLAIVNNSPSSHCGVAVAPRAPSLTLAGQEAWSAYISCFGERPFRLRKSMPLTQSATAFLKDLARKGLCLPLRLPREAAPHSTASLAAICARPVPLRGDDRESFRLRQQCSGAFCAGPADWPARQAGAGPYTREGPRLEREPSDKRRGPGSKPRAPAHVWQPAVSY